ncbi:Transcription factor btd [Trichinella patagoniensis]|uniref:Transcription factor btd n=1 Tax=Trichinella patagoniensis TaxID=990121 RepID=A0A0V0ZR79_9BILA|nr:Transcription factor btd [Trichinella patagoniensis]
MTDPMMLQQSLPENCEGVSLPTVNYAIYHDATAYNPNTSLVATSANENQDPQLQQQILFHDNGEFYQNGHSSSVANQPYSGRYEMINAENTAKNGIQWPFVCEICGSRFNNEGAKHNHMRRHSNASPFACPLCEKTFVWELSLKEHLKSHANHGDIKASMVNEIYEQQKRQCRPNRRAKNRRGFRMTDPMTLQQSLPENCEGVSLPTVNYVIYHDATAYNSNTALVATSASENQHPQLQQQILFHDNGEFYQNGHSSSVANQPYNGRHEMINAENTAKNGIQCVSLPTVNYAIYHDATAYNPNTSLVATPANENQDPQLQQQILFHDNGEFYQNGHSSSVANQPYNGRYEMINAENTAKNGIQCVSLPTVNYAIYHDATAYNPNTSLVATSANENQDPQLQQQILFHDNGEFYQNGHSISVANQPYNGRHEMINAENTAKNDIQCRTNYGTSTNAGFGNVFFNRNMRDQNESNPFPTAGNNVGK